MSEGTTRIGYVNEKGQEVIRATDRPGTGHGQRIYILRYRTSGQMKGWRQGGERLKFLADSRPRP